MVSRSVYAAFTTSPVLTIQARVASESPTPATESTIQQAVRWRMDYAAMKRAIQKNLGLLLVTGAQAFFSLTNVAVKKLNDIDPSVSTLELMAVRTTMTYIFSVVYMKCAHIPDPWLGPKGVRLLLVFRGFSGFFGLLGIYYSLQYLSLSDATVLTFLVPLCTGISGAIFLKEKYTKKEALASIFSLIGVVLIARPASLFGNTHSLNLLLIDPSANRPGSDSLEEGNPEERLLAVGVALLGVLGSTGAYTSITAIGRRAHPLHAMASFSIQCVIITVSLMIINKTPVIVPTSTEWLALLILIGFFGFAAQVLLTMGLQRETAGRGAITMYTQVVFATILERIFFKTTPSILSAIGTFIIITAALYIAVTKNQATETKRSVKFSEVSERALEEGSLEGLVHSGVNVKETSGTPKMPVEAYTRRNAILFSELQENQLEETSALLPPIAAKSYSS